MWFSTRRRKPNPSSNIVVYIEKYSKESGLVLFDFLDSNGYQGFTNRLDLNQEFGPSFVEVTGYFGKRINEGTYYYLNQKFSVTLSGALVQATNDESIVGFRIVLGEGHDELFLGVYTVDGFEFLGFSSGGVEDPFQGDKPNYFDKWEVVVKNVGQGNWNELNKNGKPYLIYDFGCSYQFTTQKMLSLSDQRIKEYDSHHPTLIISHWDVDHYCLLKNLRDFKCFRTIVARTPPPNLTSRMLYLRIEREIGIRFIRLFNANGDGAPKDYLKPLLPSGSIVQIYNAVKTRKRNSSGIVCKLETKDSVVMFTSDHHYDQIKKHISGRLKKENEIFIVPHHGGIAGKIVFPNVGIIQRTAVVSVGKNQYGHPRDEVINAIKSNSYDRYVTMYHEKDYKETVK
jgi:beta-lactamase superfamily II metal-dependent hydrolase